jgi:hypothetical protein
VRPLRTGRRDLRARKQLLLKTADISDSEEVKQENLDSSEREGKQLGQAGDDESSQEDDGREVREYFKGPGITEKFEDAVYNYYGSKSLGIEAVIATSQEEDSPCSSIVLPMTSAQTVLDLYVRR